MVEYTISPHDDNGTLFRVSTAYAAQTIEGEVCSHLISYVQAVLASYKNRGYKLSYRDRQSKTFQKFLDEHSNSRVTRRLTAGKRAFEVVIDCGLSEDKEFYEITVFFDDMNIDDKLSPAEVQLRLLEQNKVAQEFRMDLESLIRWRGQMGLFG